MVDTRTSTDTDGAADPIHAAPPPVTGRGSRPPVVLLAIYTALCVTIVAWGLARGGDDEDARQLGLRLERADRCADLFPSGDHWFDECMRLSPEGGGLLDLPPLEGEEP